MELSGAVALVTGGNGGLGQRICHALARAGVQVAVVYAKSHDQAEAVACDIASRQQVAAAALGCDITDGEAVTTRVDDMARRFSRLDILVNAAAYNSAIPFANLDAMTFEE